MIKQSVPKDEILKICDQLYQMVHFASNDYPKHKSWFYQKQLPETLQENGGRDIIIAHDENKKIYGTAFLKADKVEKKICTLFVNEEARGMGIGTKLTTKSMEILGTDKPLITIADHKLPMFEGIIKKFNWQKFEELKGVYNINHTEIVFNGRLK